MALERTTVSALYDELEKIAKSPRLLRMARIAAKKGVRASKKGLQHAKENKKGIAIGAGAGTAYGASSSSSKEKDERVKDFRAKLSPDDTAAIRKMRMKRHIARTAESALTGAAIGGGALKTFWKGMGKGVGEATHEAMKDVRKRTVPEANAAMKDLRFRNLFFGWKKKKK